MQPKENRRRPIGGRFGRRPETSARRRANPPRRRPGRAGSRPGTIAGEGRPSSGTALRFRNRSHRGEIGQRPRTGLILHRFDGLEDELRCDQPRAERRPESSIISVKENIGALARSGRAGSAARCAAGARRPPRGGARFAAPAASPRAPRGDAAASPLRADRRIGAPARPATSGFDAARPPDPVGRARNLRLDAEGTGLSWDPSLRLASARRPGASRDRSAGSPIASRSEGWTHLPPWRSRARRENWSGRPASSPCAVRNAAGARTRCRSGPIWR